jgi:hypothetical protein
MFGQFFSDEGRDFRKWEPSKSYYHEKIVCIFLACMGEALVVGGLLGLMFLGTWIDIMTGFDLSLLIAIVFIIPFLMGLVCIFLIPNTIYYFIMWKLTKDSYYINEYNEKT